MLKLFQYLCAAVVMSAIALGLPAPPAAAQAPLCDDNAMFGGPMTATSHRVDNSTVLVLAGRVSSDKTSLDRVLDKIKSVNSYSEVWMCSPGGDVFAGQKIGLELSRAKATVHIPKGYQCISACTIAMLGGYARIIDPGAKFTIHASSSFSGWGTRELGRNPVTDEVEYGWSSREFKCREAELAQICALIRADVYSNNLPQCSNWYDLYDTGKLCFFIDEKGIEAGDPITVNSLYFIRASSDPALVEAITRYIAITETGYMADLVRYFQEMLLDRQTNWIKPEGYAAATSSFHVVPLYSPSNHTIHARDLQEDFTAFQTTSDPTATLALWQVILTDVELSTYVQFGEHLKSGQFDLGRAGQDAVKIFNAMLTCQIQSGCDLEPHEAAALGFNNMSDFQ